MNSIYSFNLPPEERVIRRNRTITTYYAQLYRSEPKLYKWAGMAAFASFHIGEKLKLHDWRKTKIKSFSDTCQKQNKSLEDDFQIIRIINNKIFTEIGSMHLAFSELDYDLFKSQLIATKKSTIIIEAFNKLHEARKKIDCNDCTSDVTKQIWQANIEILWHEQFMVVQPLFNKLSNTFSSVMTFIASFDYNINHKKTNWKLASRFVSFMFIRGLSIIRKNYFFPNVINFEHRWYWISEDLLKKWQRIESNENVVLEKINYLSHLEHRTLILTKKSKF